MELTLAVVGATGNVGRIMLGLLEQRNFPAEKVLFLASARSAGKPIQFMGQDYKIEELTADSFNEVDLALCSTPDETARDFIPHAVKAGCVCVDESGYFRMHEEVPLVIPEVNADAIANHRGIISSPNCSTTQMVQALKPLHDRGKVRRVVVSTYQAASGAGKSASEELNEQADSILRGQTPPAQEFAYPLAFNCIPQIGSEKEAGFTSEEVKMIYETRKILGDQSIMVCPTCVRIPVTNCHSESILVETETEITVEEARELFAATSGLVLMDDLANKLYPMPNNCDGLDDTFIGRVRKDPSHPRSLTFWCVSDNLRKGAATNAVQIAERIVAGWADGSVPKPEKALAS